MLRQEQQNKLLQVYVLTAFVFYVLIFILKVLELQEAYKYCIPLYVGLVFLYSISANIKATWLISLALFFALVADSVINLTTANFGVVIFCGTHLCLILFYLKKKSFHYAELILLLPILLYTTVYCLKVVDLTSDAFLKIGIPIYMLLLSVMLWRAFCLLRDPERLKIILGSLLFFITDITVILELIYDDQTLLVIDAWITYPPALFLLSLIGKNDTLALKV